MKLAGAYINDEAYGRLAALAAANNRTLAGQCRHLFDRALKGDLEVPDGPVAHTGVKARAAEAEVPGEPAVAKPFSNIPRPVLPPTVMPHLSTATGATEPAPQALRKARAGRGGGTRGGAVGCPTAVVGVGDVPYKVRLRVRAWGRGRRGSVALHCTRHATPPRTHTDHRPDTPPATPPPPRPPRAAQHA